MIIILRDNVVASSVINTMGILAVATFVPQLVPLMATPAIYRI